MLCGSQYLCHINYFEYPVSLPRDALHTPHLVIIIIILCLSYLINIDEPESKDQVQYPKESNPKRKIGV